MPQANMRYSSKCIDDEICLSFNGLQLKWFAASETEWNLYFGWVCVSMCMFGRIWDWVWVFLCVCEYNIDRHWYRYRWWNINLLPFQRMFKCSSHQVLFRWWHFHYTVRCLNDASHNIKKKPERVGEGDEGRLGGEKNEAEKNLKHKITPKYTHFIRSVLLLLLMYTCGNS